MILRLKARNKPFWNDPVRGHVTGLPWRNVMRVLYMGYWFLSFLQGMGIFFLVMPLAQTWLIGHEHMCFVSEIALRTCYISEMSRQGRPVTWPLTGSFQNGLLHALSLRIIGSIYINHFETPTNPNYVGHNPKKRHPYPGLWRSLIKFTFSISPQFAIMWKVGFIFAYYIWPFNIYR